jgi:hypothetical protein
MRLWSHKPQVLGPRGSLLTNRMSESFTYGSVGGVGRKPGPYPAANDEERGHVAVPSLASRARSSSSLSLSFAESERLLPLSLRHSAAGCKVIGMNLAEIEQEARGLTDADRAALVLALMESLKPPGSEISDLEIAKRDEELESGAVAPILHEEFVRRVREDRGR